MAEHLPEQLIENPIQNTPEQGPVPGLKPEQGITYPGEQAPGLAPDKHGEPIIENGKVIEKEVPVPQNSEIPRTGLSPEARGEVAKLKKKFKTGDPKIEINLNALEGSELDDLANAMLFENEE